MCSKYFISEIMFLKNLVRKISKLYNLEVTFMKGKMVILKIMGIQLKFLVLQE